MSGGVECDCVMRAILIRVGADSKYGRWHSPVDPATNEFVYVPIPEQRECRLGFATPYATLRPALEAFAAARPGALRRHVNLPDHLAAGAMHLDPDFRNLTYGDKPTRGRRLSGFGAGDAVVFYAGLRPTQLCQHRLVYAVIGLFVVREVVRLRDVSADRLAENAHTRRLIPRDEDVIVRADPARSGRLRRCIPIGEWRARAYRVRRDLLDAWGDLSCRDGFLQLSGVPPTFRNPRRFMAWFEKQAPEIVAANNPLD